MTAVPIPDLPPKRSAEAGGSPAGGHLLVVPDLAGFAELRIWAESYDDVQKARIACANRMERGGVPPEVFAAQITALEQAEHQLKLALGRCYRRVVPVGIREWQAGMFGIGAHLLARLLGALGHPRIATPFHWEGDGDKRVLVADEVFERSVRQLWAYCGHGDPSRRKRKGMTADEAFGLGSPRCKMLVHLLAEATIKCRAEPVTGTEAKPLPAGPASSSPTPPNPSAEASEQSAGSGDPSRTPPSSRPEAVDGAAGSDVLPHPAHRASGSRDGTGGVGGCSADQPRVVPVAIRRPAGRRYRQVYDTRRAYTAHSNPDWTAGHSHNDALRIVGKEILRDLWVAAGADQ